MCRAPLRPSRRARYGASERSVSKGDKFRSLRNRITTLETPALVNLSAERWPNSVASRLLAAAPPLPDSSSIVSAASPSVVKRHIFAAFDSPPRRLAATKRTRRTSLLSPYAEVPPSSLPPSFEFDVPPMPSTPSVLRLGMGEMISMSSGLGILDPSSPMRGLSPTGFNAAATA
tara:strand:- start:1329 stop:1850 length:522 start_codon:yes stop_codon:yes gene_type:complete